LTGSLGVAGLSETTSFFSNFNIRLTRSLTATADVDFSLFDTDDEDFNVLEAKAGIQYWITPWLSSDLGYTHRFRDRDIEEINSNSVALFFTAHFDIWPNPGLWTSLLEPPPSLSRAP